MITKILSRKKIDFPVPGSQLIIENNKNDKLAIHIHLGQGPIKVWSVRLHFTKKEFKIFCEDVIKKGKI